MVNWIDARFDWFSTAVAGVMFVYLLGVAPTLGHRRIAALRRDRDNDLHALVSHYRRSIAVGLALAALVGVTVAISPGLDLADIGVRRPEDGQWVFAAFLLVVFLLAMSSSAVRARRMIRNGRVFQTRVRIGPILPRTDAERRWAVAYAVSAGVWEEILFRGLAIAVGTGLLGLDPTIAAALSVLAFIPPHRYQGLAGMLAAGYFGLLFAATYVLSGTIVVGVVLHAFNNTLALLLERRPPTEPSPADPVASPTA